MNDSAFVSSDEIRDRFSRAMSAMYQREVPQYAALLELVADINARTLADSPDLQARLAANGELDRLAVERHGAIRVGTANELGMLRRLFAVMGMAPVGYYDLSAAGVPVHSTAFRPVDEAALQKNPFRLFTSLLRLDLIEDAELRDRAIAILDKRDIFTAGVRELIDTFESEGGLREEEAERFVAEALETFRWHEQATVDYATYLALAAEHRLIADVVCFRGPHINHLTPRTLDIDAAQAAMPDYGMTPKAVIEGPPAMTQPILLRQTSFKALEESIRFAGETEGRHTARFGEIEQRGIALTPEGRALYDQLLAEAQSYKADTSNEEYQTKLAEIFERFPSDLKTLRNRKLAYFRYEAVGGVRLTANAPTDNESAVAALVSSGAIVAHPITYEDFLPVSAAGIFQSNLDGPTKSQSAAANANMADLEAALGVDIIDEFALYAEMEVDSMRRALIALMPADLEHDTLH
ncbi:MAG: DUF1338 family protein [Salinisphaera sp.]|jgi:uncharacterized glyoxalase superfamily metalloenzyme YdcJ|nr:DUF1338 family protein [Salinisphaera sp.]